MKMCCGLKQKIRRQEYALGNDRAALMTEFSSFRRAIAKPQYVGLSFAAGIALGFLHPASKTSQLRNRLRKHIISKAPSLLSAVTSNIRLILPYILGA